MAKAKIKKGGPSAIDAKIIDQLAKYLVYRDRTDELQRKYRKLYAESGVILKYFSKLHDFNQTRVETLVKQNIFFEIAKAEVEDGFLVKSQKELSVATFAGYDKLERAFVTDRERLIADANHSSLLLDRLTGVIEPDPLFPHKNIEDSIIIQPVYQRPRLSSESLYSSFMPEEYKKYRSETRALGNIEKRFNAKLQKSDSFRFKNDMVANSLMSWFQSLLITEPEIISEHLFSGDFEHWLRTSVSDRELANICSNLTRNLEGQNLGPREIKREVMKRLRRTSYESSIYNAITKPLIKKLKSGEPETVQQAAKKLMDLGDERAVEGLIGKMFESIPETRRVVMEALAVIGDPRAVPPLLKIFEHSTDTDDRLSALSALAMFDDKRCRQALKKAAKKESGEIGAEAKRILEGLKQDKVKNE